MLGDGGEARRPRAAGRWWDGLLTLLTKAEHYPPPDHSEQFICIAWISLDRNLPPRIVMVDTAESAQALTGETVAPTFISMSLVLYCLRGNAAKAGIDLPQHLTVDPDDKPAYKRWRTEIDLYREVAGARLAKTKPLTPA